jgi:hypothetical protein
LREEYRHLRERKEKEDEENYTIGRLIVYVLCQIIRGDEMQETAIGGRIRCRLTVHEQF